MEPVLRLKCIFTDFTALKKKKKKGIIELTPSQKHNKKADGVHCLVRNMLKVHISQAKSCFLEQ